MRTRPFLSVALALLLPALVVVAALRAPARGAVPSRLPAVRTTTDVGLAAPININSILPIVNNQSISNAQLNVLLYPPLLWIGNKITIRWKKSLARSIRVTDHDTHFLVTIRPWRWSDGRPVTAADVVYSFTLIRAFGTRYLNYSIGGIPTIVRRTRVLGPHRFLVVTRHPVNVRWFELNGLTQFQALPRFAWKGLSVNELYDDQTEPRLARVVDGPYKLERFVLGREAVLVRNPAFSGPPGYFRRLVYAMYTSSEGAFWALRSGHLDIGNVPHALFLARHLLHGMKSCVTNGGFGINYVVLNFTNPRVSFFHDLGLRRALQYAINEKLFIRVAFDGFGTPGFNPVPGSPPTYLSPLLRHLTDHPGLMYRPRRARALLRAAGWRRRPGRGWVRRDADGIPLRFTLLFPSGTRTEIIMADILKQDWKRIGVDVRLRQLPFNLLLAKLDAPHGHWDAAMIAWDYEPDYYPTGEGLFNTSGGTNYGHYSNPVLDRLIRATNVEPGRKPLYAYERFMMRHLPVLFLPLQGNLVKYRSDLSLKAVDSTLYHVACVPPPRRR
jgi:peptide/nickel transport system substrate-binding protein